MKRIHLCMSVGGALKNRAFEGLTDKAGKPLSRARAEFELRRLVADGIKVIPVGPACEGFSDQTGCLGHEVSE